MTPPTRLMDCQAKPGGPGFDYHCHCEPKAWQSPGGIYKSVTEYQEIATALAGLAMTAVFAVRSIEPVQHRFKAHRRSLTSPYRLNISK